VKYLNPGAVFGIASLLLAAAYLTLAVLLHYGQTLDPGVWVNSLVQFQFFALGTMMAIVLRARVPKIAKPLRWASFLAGLLCLRAAQAAVYNNDVNLPHNFAHIAPRFLIALLGCLCLFFSLLDVPADRLQRPFISLGKISYGLYVYHVLCLAGSRLLVGRFEARSQLDPVTAELVAMALALPTTVAMAVLSYRYLETPFLRFKKRFTVIRSRPV
jgi:peptidoglycan/LPS O-acetylase OafA/YrhL